MRSLRFNDRYSAYVDKGSESDYSMCTFLNLSVDSKGMSAKSNEHTQYN